MSLAKQDELLFDEDYDDPSGVDYNLDSELNDGHERGKKRSLNDDIKEDNDEKLVKLNPNECFLDFERDKICKIVDELYTAESDSIHDCAIFDYIKKNQSLADKNITAKCGVFKLFMNTKDTISMVNSNFYYGSFETELDRKKWMTPSRWWTQLKTSLLIRHQRKKRRGILISIQLNLEFWLPQPQLTHLVDMKV